MANPISENLKKGTVGELLVQLRFLQYGIQAAPPLKDTGNDLIAIKGNTFKSIQVRTTTTKTFLKPSEKKKYHLLAIVDLSGEGNRLFLDKSQIYLIKKEKVINVSNNVNRLKNYRMTQELINELFR